MDVAHPTGPAPAFPETLKYPTGSIVAALVAAWLGLIALAIVNVAANVNAGFKTAITLNSGIGPYSGKELFMLLTWFVSWPILHFALRKREMPLKTWFGVFLVGMLAAVLLMWPPVFIFIGDKIMGK